MDADSGKLKLLIAGAGKQAREVLARLGEAWDVTIVDLDENRLNILQKSFRQVKKSVKGDASSLVTLAEAGLSEQEFVAAVTNRDPVNIEVCRLAKEAKVKNVVALAHDTRNMKKFEELDVRIISGGFLVAREVQLFLENPQISLTTIGRGKGEVMEIEVTQSAPVVGRKIGELGSPNWMIASIYRQGELIIHHDHDMEIREGDRVTVVGQTDLYHAIYHLFKLDQPSFPLRFGQNILVCALELAHVDALFPEAAYLVKNTKAREVSIFAGSEGSEGLEEKVAAIEGEVEVGARVIEGSIQEKVSEASMEESFGCVLIPPMSSSTFLWMFGREKIMPIARTLGAPLVISRGTQPYKDILVPYNGTRESALALEVAHDIASQVKGEIAIVVVSEPSYIRGEEPENWAERAIDHAREISRIYRIPIKEIRRKGNRAKEVIRLTSSYDLLIMSTSEGDAPFLKPDVGELIAGKSECSVLILPPSG